MKIKSAITGFCLVAVALTAKANYDIGFQTYDFNDLNQHVAFDFGGVNRLTGPAFVGQLYVGPTVGSLAAIGSPVPFATLGSGAEGFVDSGTISVVDASLNAGSSAVYSLRAWDFVSGASYEAALATPGAHVGQSAATAITLGGTVPGNPPTLLTATANLHPSFTLSIVPVAVPEPSVLALGLLGGAALLFRRRK